MKNDHWFSSQQNESFLGMQQRTDELYQIPNMEEDGNLEFESLAIVLRDLVIFPKMITPIIVNKGINQISIEESHFRFETVIALYVDETNLKDDSAEFLTIGTEVAVGRMLSMPDGNHSALLQGRRRVEILEITQQDPFFKVRVRVIKENEKVNRQTKALIRTSQDLFEKCVQLDRSLPEDAHLFAVNIQEPGWLSDMIASAISLPIIDRQKLFICTEPKERLEMINRLLAQELDVLQLEDEIQTKVQSEVDKSQREYYLREQMKAIQNELGETDLLVSEIVELRNKVETLGLSEEAKKIALKEVDRLSQMPSMSPETAMVRSYIDWLLELPWKNSTEDNLDVKHANSVLEKNHYGLGKVKDRILEYIAIQKLKPEDSRQPILCFVGAPGTGKTSLGKSIAEALGKKFVRVSLGGIRDEAEIRGHRRTYIGALPGRILQTMKKAGTTNPLFMLDEIDKLGADFRGDPSAALLEVLDPEQNCEFSDHYLEVEFDLSKVMFITTANTLMTIPPALLDRMEVIEFSSYLEEEKIAIAKQFLIPRQLHETGIEDLNIVFTDVSIKLLIHNYTYEAGVRNLEREIGRICRKIARLKTESKTFPRKIDEKVVERFLGPQEYFELEAESEDEVGVTTAMAWTENGGDIMPVEVLVMDGKGNLQITGQIGEIMQESAQAAMSFMKSRAKALNVDSDLFENVDVHVHIPEGGIPKDGPSAGITIACSIISAFTDRKVRREIAMTGEITLRGRILPVGGIREKILAAHRAGITTIIIPKKNEKDLEELNKKVRTSLNIIAINHIDEILDIALLPKQEKTEEIKIVPEK